MTIKPTPGRVVWFYPDITAFTTDQQPLAAIVAHVWSDTCVNLTVFDSNGFPQGRQSVTLVQEDQERPARGAFCTWMPYQIGQAKKHAGEVAPDAAQPPIDNAFVAPGAEPFGG